MPKWVPEAPYSLTYHFAETGQLIRVGERISARLPDAHGFDENGDQVAESPNPLAGPFIVEGAYPGDTLGVTLHSLSPNRRRGWASKSLHPNFRISSEATTPYRKEYVEWEIDLERRCARPPKEYFPNWDLELPIKTVLGCLGVAASTEEAIRSIDCGLSGGNMDYPRICAGATIYLPILVDGACLFLGDGHALQGAGEITGNGVEVSCDVTFSVKILKMNIQQPRGEDQGYLFGIANAKPLELAYRLSTDNLLGWLTTDFGLSKDQAGIISGQCVLFENGNLVSNAYTVSCLMPKVCLPGA